MLSCTWCIYITPPKLPACLLAAKIHLLAASCIPLSHLSSSASPLNFPPCHLSSQSSNSVPHMVKPPFILCAWLSAYLSIWTWLLGESERLAQSGSRCSVKKGLSSIHCTHTLASFTKTGKAEMYSGVGGGMHPGW